jgi:multidrug transporter EmrE-like cation transporter
MSATAMGFVLIGLCALIEGFAQIALKISAAAQARKVPLISAGVGLFVVSAVLYSNALRFLNISVAYAVESLGFVSVAILSQWLLRERVTGIRWIGIALIMTGTALIVAQT